MNNKISLFAAAALLLCGCNNSNNNKSAQDVKNSKEIFYTSSDRNVYEKGLIIGGDPAVYVDFDSMERSVLCATPNCTHTSSECLGKIVGESPIMYNDYLYFFDYKTDLKEEKDGKRNYCMDSKLCRVSLNSSKIEIVSQFTDCIPHDLSGCVVCSDTLYFTATDMNVEEDEYGAIKASNVGGKHYLCSIGLSDGVYKNYGIIYDGDRQYEAAHQSSCASITGYYDSKIYILYSFLKDMDVYETNNDGDTEDYWTLLNFEFDLNSKELKESELPASYFMNMDSYIYYDTEKKMSVIIDAGKKYEIRCKTDPMATLFNKKLFVPNEKKYYNLNDMSEHSMGECANYTVIDYYNGCYILKNGGKIKKLTEKELLALDKEE